MKHNGHDLKESWYEDCYKYSKAQQVEMIQRHYKYSENDWVLWIVADLFHNYQVKEITGEIEIKNKDDSSIDVPFLLRTPYPNKNIRQLSMKSGRKRLYGIPLVFKTFEQLCEVSEITIRWDIYEEAFLGNNDKPFQLDTKTLVIKYHLIFEKDNNNPEHHFYTVFSKDYTYDVYSANKINEYYDEFDVAIQITGSIVCEDEEWETLICETYLLKENADGAESRKLTDKEQKIFDELIEIKPDKEKINILLQGVTVKSEIQVEISGYEKTETLTAAYMADMITESCFGFCGLQEVMIGRGGVNESKQA